MTPELENKVSAAWVITGLIVTWGGAALALIVGLLR